MTTPLELEHRRLEVYGERTEEMRGIFDSEGGWTGLLERFARAAQACPPRRLRSILR